MRGFLMAAAVAALTVGSSHGTAQAQTAEAAPQALTCMTAFLAIAGSGDEADAATATVGALYYLGLLEGADGSVDWISRVAAYADTVTLETLNAAMPACYERLGARGQAMVAMGQASQAQASQPQGAPAAE